MRVAIASGKGGTGKTTMATAMALVAARAGRRVALLDCDVEEPNCHLFLHPAWEESRDFAVPVPAVDQALCTHCGECARFCEFNALACLPDQVLVFAELCHGCGGCRLICPERCIEETGRVVGATRTGRLEASPGSLSLTEGRLRIGEARVPPLIRAVKAAAPAADLVFLDAPPGTSCPVVETLHGSDRVLLVTEPTPFGLHDLELAVALVQRLELPCGVAINRAGGGDDRVQRFCAAAGVPVLAELPEDRRLAEAYARGEVIADVLPEFARAVADLLTLLEGSLEAHR